MMVVEYVYLVRGSGYVFSWLLVVIGWDMWIWNVIFEFRRS